MKEQRGCHAGRPAQVEILQIDGYILEISEDDPIQRSRAIAGQAKISWSGRHYE